jgi:hypothetical protein
MYVVGDNAERVGGLGHWAIIDAVRALYHVAGVGSYVASGFGATFLVLSATLVIGCVDIPQDPLQLDGGILTVDNRTAADWRNVEIWLNRYYRATTPSVEARSRFTVSLGSFVDGYGRRFDRTRAMITDLRLTGTAEDGTPVTLVKTFEKHPLDALQEQRQ